VNDFAAATVRSCRASRDAADGLRPAISRSETSAFPTHQRALKPIQLDYYLDEFVFRFNRRTARSRGLLFYRCLAVFRLTGAAPVWRQLAHGLGLKREIFDALGPRFLRQHEPPASGCAAQ
jgi:hypothetical protein